MKRISWTSALFICALNVTAAAAAVYNAMPGPTEDAFTRTARRENVANRLVPPAFVSQFDQAIVELMATYRSANPQLAMAYSRLFAGISAKTGDRLFFLLVPMVLKNDLPGPPQLFWFADTTLLSNDKVPFGFDEAKAHLPIREAPEEFAYRPYKSALEWGLVDSDFDDFQGEVFYLSDSHRLTGVGDNSFQILPANEEEIFAHSSEYAEMDRLMARYKSRTGTMTLIDLAIPTHLLREHIEGGNAIDDDNDRSTEVIACQRVLN